MAAAGEGCYEASRAAALSGVPISTVYYWAKTGVVVPSVSPVREKLWSYADLMGLRLVSWLRRAKELDGKAVTELVQGPVIPGSPMRQVRQTLAYLVEHRIDLWHADEVAASPLLVDRGGKIWIRTPDGSITDNLGNRTLEIDEGSLELLGPFDVSGQRGPDLIAPRPMLRIVPLKVAGEPHVVDSRVTSRSLAALAERGFSPDELAHMYALDKRAIKEALDLERQLSMPSRAAA